MLSAANWTRDFPVAPDHFSEQEVIGVAIDPLVPGNIVKAFLACDELEDVGGRGEVCGITPGNENEIEKVAESAGLMEHLAKCDGSAVIGQREGSGWC